MAMSGSIVQPDKWSQHKRLGFVACDPHLEIKRELQPTSLNHIKERKMINYLIWFENKMKQNDKPFQVVLRTLIFLAVISTVAALLAAMLPYVPSSMFWFGSPRHVAFVLSPEGFGFRMSLWHFWFEILCFTMFYMLYVVIFLHP